MTPPISRGFRGRRRDASEAVRAPPGQYGEVRPDMIARDGNAIAGDLLGREPSE
jgi:hypothetical protein